MEEILRPWRIQLDERDRVPLFLILRRAYRYAVDTHADNAECPETVRDYWRPCLDMAFEDAGLTGDEKVTSDGVTVWVESATGCLARFGAKGIDVRSADTTACLECTHKTTTAEDWRHFQAFVWRHHGVWVTDDHRPKRFSPT